MSSVDDMKRLNDIMRLIDESSELQNQKHMYWCPRCRNFVPSHNTNHSCAVWGTNYGIPGEVVTALQFDLLRERDELRAKLSRVKEIALGIANPLLALREEAHQSGCELNIGVAIELSNDPHYYKDLGAKIIKECE